MASRSSTAPTSTKREAKKETKKEEPAVEDLVCQLCGEAGHHAQECPDLVLENEVKGEMEVDEANMRRKFNTSKLVTPARPITRQLFKTEEESPDGSTGWDVVSSLTAEELNMTARASGEGPLQEEDHAGTDWPGGGLSEPITGLVDGGRLQHGSFDGIAHEDFPMEEAAVATSCEKGSGRHAGLQDAGSSLEAQPSLAGDASGQGSRDSMGALRSNAAEDERPAGVPYDVRPQRGLMQKLKQGVSSRGLTLGSYVARLRKKREKCVVLEIFAGTARLTSMARCLRGRWWHAMSPVDILSGQDMRKREDQQKVWQMIHREEPDLITLSMPCGPWCQWMFLCHPDDVAAKRKEDMPL